MTSPRRLHALLLALPLLSASCQTSDTGGVSDGTPGGTSAGNTPNVKELVCPACTPKDGGDTSDIGGIIRDCGKRTAMRPLTAEDELAFDLAQLHAFSEAGFEGTVVWTPDSESSPPSATGASTLVVSAVIDTPTLESWERCEDKVSAQLTLELSTSDGALRGSFSGQISRQRGGTWRGGVGADLAGLAGSLDLGEAESMRALEFAAVQGTLGFGFDLREGRLEQGQLGARYEDPTSWVEVNGYHYYSRRLWSPISGHVPAQLCGGRHGMVDASAATELDGVRLEQRYAEFRDAINALASQPGGWAGGKSGSVSVRLGLGDFDTICSAAHDPDEIRFPVSGEIATQDGALKVQLTSALLWRSGEGRMLSLSGSPSQPVPPGDSYVVAHVTYPIRPDGSLDVIAPRGQMWLTKGYFGPITSDGVSATEEGWINPDAAPCISWPLTNLFGCGNNPYPE
jgi:hypothetical protein